MNRYNHIRNIFCLTLLTSWIGCTKVNICDDPSHIHKTPGKTTVTVDWTQTTEGDSEKEMMKFAFYPQTGGEPILVETDYGYAQTRLEPGNYRVIAFNRKARNIETTLPDDYRRAKASISQQITSRAVNEPELERPGWFASGVGSVAVDASRTGELVLPMVQHVRMLNIRITLEGDPQAIKNISGELNGLSKSINLNTGLPWEGETGKVIFNPSILEGNANFSTTIFGIDSTAPHVLSFNTELQDGSIQTLSQDISKLVKNTHNTDIDINIMATIRINIPEEGSQPEVTLEEVKTTGTTTFTLDWGEEHKVHPQTMKYVIYPVSGGKVQTFTADNRSFTVALAPGSYHLFTYGENTTNITVDCPDDFQQATARAVSVDGHIPEPGYFFLGLQDIVIEENAIQTFPLPVKNYTKDFNVSMKIKGDGRLISKIEAVLTGVSEGIYLQTGKVTASGQDYILHTSNDAAVINISGRMLGIDKNQKQLLRLKLTYRNGETQLIEEDISDLLEGFNESTPEEIPDIDADVEITSPSNTNISAAITNWKITERDITPGKGDKK